MKIQSISVVVFFLVLLASCYSPVAYRFQLVRDPLATGSLPDGVFEDADVRLTFALDATARRQIVISVTNKTGQNLQVNWRSLTVTDSSGVVLTPRPQIDRGWVAPGTTQVDEVSPFSLPDTTEKSNSYDGQRFELRVPLTIRNETRPYAFAFTAHVTEIEKEPQ